MSKPELSNQQLAKRLKAFYAEQERLRRAAEDDEWADAEWTPPEARLGDGVREPDDER